MHISFVCCLLRCLTFLIIDYSLITASRLESFFLLPTVVSVSAFSCGHEIEFSPSVILMLRSNLSNIHASCRVAGRNPGVAGSWNPGEELPEIPFQMLTSTEIASIANSISSVLSQALSLHPGRHMPSMKTCFLGVIPSEVFSVGLDFPIFMSFGLTQ